jgi:hypothetical protein
MEAKEIVSIWDLHLRINFDDITKIMEGEKYSVIQEKIESLRKSSDSVASDSEYPSTITPQTRGTNNNKHENIESEEEEELLTATTAPGIIFPTAEARLAHFRSDYHRWNLKLKLMQMPMLARADFDDMMAAARTTTNSQSNTTQQLEQARANGEEVEEEEENAEEFDLAERQALMLAEAEKLAAEEDEGMADGDEMNLRLVS